MYQYGGSDGYQSRYSRGGTYNRDNSRTGRSGLSSSLPQDRDFMEGLQTAALRTLSKPQASIISRDEQILKPQNLKCIGSYNWVDEPTPTIIVPGSPPVWRDRPVPYSVRADSGVQMVDQNSFRMGSASNLLPLFRAVDIVSEANADTSMNWGAVDVVTDRNGLRKLLRWIMYSDVESTEPLKEFRIDLQLGGNKTVLMHRREKRDREISVPPKAGFGHNFEHESTYPAEGCQRSTAHHRIVQYDLDGLRMVVRFEVDACTAQSSSYTLRTSTGTQSRTSTRTSNVDDLASALGGLGVSASSRSSTAATSAITIIRAGAVVPQSTLVELATRSARYIDQFNWQEKYPQLLLSSTPQLFLGAHNRGTFERVYKHALGNPSLRHIEQDTRIMRAFKQLVSILRTIQQLVKIYGDRGRLSLLCNGDGVLKVYERTSNTGCLTDSELARFRA